MYKFQLKSPWLLPQALVFIEAPGSRGEGGIRLRTKDFAPDPVIKTEDILCVFQGFDKQELGQKIRYSVNGAFPEATL